MEEKSHQFAQLSSDAFDSVKYIEKEGTSDKGKQNKVKSITSAWL